MPSNMRRVRRTLAWALLLALGCAGGGSCGGCDGCGGGGGCLAPIPGGFLPDQRRPNALGVKVTKTGFDFIEQQANDLIGESTSQVQGLECIDASQRIKVLDLPPILGGPQYADLKVFICDLTQNDACEAADNDPALHVDEAGHGKVCEAELKISGIDMAPVGYADGSVDVLVNVDVSINTGRIPLKVKAPVCGGFKCSLEVDTDKGARPTLKIPIRIMLRTSPAPQNILTFDVAPLPDLKSLVDNEDFKLESDGGSLCQYGCDVIDLGPVKDQLMGQAQEQVTKAVRDAIDKFRCQACDPAAPVCPAGSACDGEMEICLIGSADASPRQCPPMFPGIEGRTSLAEAMGDMLASGAGSLDLSIVAGGPAPAAKEENGGLVVGMQAGSAAPTRSACVPFERFVHAPAERLGFDAAAAEHVTGLPDVGAYDFGLSVSDLFMDETAYSAWAAGALCLQVGTETTDVLSSSLFATFIPSLSLLAHKEEVPMLLAMRPQHAPQITIGRGTTKTNSDGTVVPLDPLLTIELKDFGIDFYAQLEDRYVRLFTLLTDVKLPMALEFDPVANTVLPVLAELDTLFGNVRVINAELLAEDPESLATIVGQLVGLVQPQIAGALQPFELPDLQGIKLEVKGARGVVPMQNGDAGFQHLALFMKLGAATASPLSLSVNTSAELRALDAAKVVAGRVDPSTVRIAHLAVEGGGLQHENFKGYEFSTRVDGGLWTVFRAGPELAVPSALFAFDGRHVVDVRAREIGEPGTVDRTPARVEVVVDELPPHVALVEDGEAGLLLTEASDVATRTEDLRARYRRSGAAWSEWGPRQAIALAGLGGLEVEVQDAAGHVAKAAWGRVAPVPVNAGRAPADEGGCAATGVDALAILALAGLALRRRARA